MSDCILKSGIDCPQLDSPHTLKFTKDSKPIGIPNLRFVRTLVQPSWTIRGKYLSASVTQKKIKRIFAAQEAQLRVKISPQRKGPWTVKSLTTSSEDAKLHPVTLDGTPQQGEQSITLDFVIPKWCDARKGRQPVLLEVVFKSGNKELHDALALDYHCLVGDIIKNNDASEIAELVQHYSKHDPLINNFATQLRGIPVKSAAKEVERLKSLLKIVYKRDPISAVSEIPSGAAYMLSPTETWRYGGDCEDYAILTGAFLVRRGVPGVHIADSGFHVWTEIPPLKTGDSYTVVDLTQNEVNLSKTVTYKLEPIKPKTTQPLPGKWVTWPNVFGSAKVVTVGNSPKETKEKK